MKYEITIKTVTPIDGEKYPSRDTVYEQTLETEYESWLVDVIKTVNEI